MYRCVTIPQSKIKDFCQPPLHKGAFSGGRLPPLHPRSHISNVGAAISRPLFVANFNAL